MDINTETIIRKNIKEYISNLREKESKKCTVITISQKISSIIDCDKILVLDEERWLDLLHMKIYWLVLQFIKNFCVAEFSK